MTLNDATELAYKNGFERGSSFTAADARRYAKSEDTYKSIFNDAVSTIRAEAAKGNFKCTWEYALAEEPERIAIDELVAKLCSLGYMCGLTEDDFGLTVKLRISWEEE